MENRGKILKLLEIGIVILVVLYYAIILTHKVNLTTADLGRHIKNGEIFFQSGNILTTNFYSYTETDFKTENHHWGFGVLTYLLWEWFGIYGPQLFFVAISLATFFIFFNFARKQTGAGIAGILALFILPLLGERTEIRPEAISYLFAAIFFYILYRYRDGTLRARWLYILLLIQIIWTNTHIYFFLGPALVGAFWLESALVKELRTKYFLFFSRLLCATIFATLINPFGIKGALAPLTIFENYGYRLAENQSVWFIEKIVNSPSFLFFKIVFVIFVASLIAAFFAKRKAAERYPLSLLFISVGIGGMGLVAIRNFALFGFFALALIAFNLSAIREKLYAQKISYFFHDRSKVKKLVDLVAIGIIGISSFIVFQNNYFVFLSNWGQFGLGLAPRNSAAADFFKQNNLQGPIFNNYDIGGYLIFHLFPRERVFVDNRPEAYSVDFFQKVYIPMQESNAIWKIVDEEYKFNTLFFSHRDLTPWGQNFLVQRVQDPAWAPVFVDNYAIIFLKRAEQNKKIIDQYEIPKNRFQITPSS
ncbi:MAG: hypothetical protein HYW78_00540 [Parcubacteria group bacterium]|nr:hypothetical protein [Parcubacteria group bacterium]